MLVVEDANVSSPHVLHHCRDSAYRAGSHEKVHMIWHEHIGMDRAFVPNGRVAHASQIQTSIRVIEKTQAAVIPPLNNVQRNARQL
jgi:hypothetical protein